MSGRSGYTLKRRFIARIYCPHKPIIYCSNRRAVNYAVLLMNYNFTVFIFGDSRCMSNQAAT